MVSLPEGKAGGWQPGAWLPEALQPAGGSAAGLRGAPFRDSSLVCMQIILMRKDKLSTSFGVHVSAVLQQFCSLFTAVSLFSLLVKPHLLENMSPLSL